MMQENRSNNKIFKPTNVHKFKTSEKILIILLVITFFGIFLIASAGMVSVMPALSTLMVITGLLLCVCSIPLEIVIFYLQNNKSYSLKTILKCEKFKNFCYQEQLYTQSLYDNRQINIPEAEITNQGFRLKALPGIAEKTLNSKDDLDNFFAQNGLDLYISNSYAGGDGWIYFIIQKNFRKEGIDHEKKPE